MAPDLTSAAAGGAGAAGGGSVRIIVQYSQSPSIMNPPIIGAPVGGSATLGGALGSVLGGVTTGLSSTLTGVAGILSLGGVVDQVVDSLNVVICTLPGSALNSLIKDPTVVYVSPDRLQAARLDYTAAAVNAGSAWTSNLTGKGIGVAIIDSGIEVNPDLKTLGLISRVVYSENFANGSGHDGYGHGTHVAGIVGASGLSSHCADCVRSLVGMAPQSSLIDLRVLDANGEGSDSAVIAAIDRAISLRKIYNIRVMNLSLGRPIYESYQLDPVCQAVEAAWKAGIVVVAAAGNDGRDNSVGNDGYATIESPGNDPYVITVGAMKAMGTYGRADDLIASYSSKGPTALDHIVKPDLVAPGNHVVSLEARNSTLAQDAADQVPVSYYTTSASNAPSSTFLMLNGTSMATPVVSGAVADLLEGNPSLTPDQVKARLMKTAYKKFPASSTAVDPVTGQSFVSQYDILTIGAGYLDIDAALKNHELATGTALSPTAVYDATSGNVYLTFDPSSTWDDSAIYGGKPVVGTRSVWGTQSVWGTAVVSADRSVWGTQSVWGTASESGFRSVWGTQSVWGTGTDSATRSVWGTDSSSSDSDRAFTSTPR